MFSSAAFGWEDTPCLRLRRHRGGLLRWDGVVVFAFVFAPTYAVKYPGLRVWQQAGFVRL